MNKKTTLKLPLTTVVLCVIVIVAYMLLVTPPVQWEGFIMLIVPPLLGAVGFVSAVRAFSKHKIRTKSCIALIFLNLFFMFWWFNMWFIGYLFGYINQVIVVW